MAVVRHLHSNALYIYKGDNIFQNIHTGKEGFVNDELARKIFRINAELTYLLNEYPIVEEFIRVLKLKIDKNNE